MATGTEFLQQLETRFGTLSTEEKLEKMVEYRKKLLALQAQGLSEEEAVAQLIAELPLPSPVPVEDEDYGRISHPKKPLLTGLLYAAALLAVLGAGVLFNLLLR